MIQPPQPHGSSPPFISCHQQAAGTFHMGIPPWRPRSTGPPAHQPPPPARCGHGGWGTLDGASGSQLGDSAPGDAWQCLRVGVALGHQRVEDAAQHPVIHRTARHKEVPAHCQQRPGLETLHVYPGLGPLLQTTLPSLPGSRCGHVITFGPMGC